MARTKASAKKMTKDSKSRTLREYFKPKANDGSAGTSNAVGAIAKTPIANSNAPMRRTQIAQETSIIGDTESEKDKEIEFKFITKAVKGEHIARGKANDSLYSALMSMDVVKGQREKNKNKELHLVDPHGKTAFNLGMPLKCLGEETTFEIRFYSFGRVLNSDGRGEISDKHRSYDAGDKEIVTFWVNTKSKRKIFFSNSLPKYIHSVCVFAAKGESFCDALCRDGRFLPYLKDAEWKMVEGNDVFLSTYPVGKYAKRTFSVEFTSKKKRSTANQTSEHSSSPVQKSRESFSKSLLDQYPRLQEQGTLIQEVLLAEAKTQKVSLKTLLKLQKTEFVKTTVNSTAARVVRMLACRLDRVGYIQWDNQGKTGCATCFLLAGPYILTCHHVIRDIVGDGVEETHWPEIVSWAATVSFTYESPRHLRPEKFYRIEAWLGASEKNLDYALLRLKGNCDTFPRGLISLVSKEPYNGLVYIIGHPSGDEKTTDACTVIPFMDRHSEIVHRLHAEHSLQFFSQYSFNDRLSRKALTYDTSFFEGSSGSPVFDFSGQLVAMHSAGIRYPPEQQPPTLFEFGWLMQEICSDIESKNKALFDLLLGEDALKNRDLFISSHCSDIDMDGEEEAESCANGDAMEIEGDRPPPRKRRRSNL